MNDNLIDVLMYLMDNYIDDSISDSDDRSEIVSRLQSVGFSSHEIGQAFDWLEALSNHNGTPFTDPAPQSLRVYRDFEIARLGIEGVGFLHQLEQKGVLDPSTREQVIERFLALNSSHIDLEELKWVIPMVLFNQTDCDASSFTWLADLVYSEQPRLMH